MVTAPVGLAEVKRVFGDPAHFRRDDGTLTPEWESAHIVRVKLPSPMSYVQGGNVTRVAVHRLIADITAATLADLLALGPEMWSELQPYGGGYEPRLQRGSATPSLHTWGLALDFNPGKYPLGSLKRMPDAIVDVFKRHAWTYGGDFHSRKDGMHFQFASGV